MTDSAFLYPPHFGDVLNALPEYEEYLDAETAFRGEAPYRMALGRHIKDWGERLLDLSEYQGNLLPRRDMRIIDHLLGAITEIFGLLNCGGQVRRRPEEESDRRELRDADARLLRLLEEGSQLLEGMHRSEWAGEWIEHDSRAFYRKLRSIHREIRDRNLQLGLGARPILEMPQSSLNLI
jgi:hypothetical protein